MNDLLLNRRNSEDSLAPGKLLIWRLIRDGCENLMRIFVLLHEAFAVSLLSGDRNSGLE